MAAAQAAAQQFHGPVHLAVALERRAEPQWGLAIRGHGGLAVAARCRRHLPVHGHPRIAAMRRRRPAREGPRSGRALECLRADVRAQGLGQTIHTCTLRVERNHQHLVRARLQTHLGRIARGHVQHQTFRRLAAPVDHRMRATVQHDERTHHLARRIDQDGILATLLQHHLHRVGAHGLPRRVAGDERAGLERIAQRCVHHADLARHRLHNMRRQRQA